MVNVPRLNVSFLEFQASSRTQKRHRHRGKSGRLCGFMTIPRFATRPPVLERSTSLHMAFAEDGDGGAEVEVGGGYNKETVGEEIYVEGASVDTVMYIA